MTYNSYNIAMTIKMVARNKNILIKDMLSKCDLGINYLVRMAGGSYPSVDSMAKIADVLDVSVDYLLGRTDKPEINR